MSEAQSNKKYYWLRLHRDFFKRHDIRIVEGMPNGKDYILFYLKLLVESIDHEGQLRFSDLIPYSEEMLATITNTNVDVVRSAMKLFTQLGMISVLDDQTIFMTEVDKMIGCETVWAEKKRIWRENQKALTDTARTSEDNVRQEKEIEIEKEIEKEIDNISPKISVIVDYLNVKTGAHYKSSSAKTKILIKARLNEGFTVDDFKTVIDKKTAEWKTDVKMAQYLRPETLFGTKFEGYLNQKEVKPGTNQFNNFSNTHDYDMSALEASLLGG